LRPKHAVKQRHKRNNATQPRHAPVDAMTIPYADHQHPQSK
jgi:hypothetical protein